MAGVNETRIVLTAEDRTSPALASVTRGLGGMQAEAMRASSALGAIGFTAAAASAMRYVKSIIDAADETQKLSQRIGIAAKDIAGWKLAADLSGASIESVAKGIKSLSTFSAEYGETLRKAGIDTQDPQRALIQLADLFAALPDGMQKTALATKLFGKAGLDLLPMLNQGSAALQKQIDKAAEYGRKLAEFGPDAERFNDQLEETGFYAQAAGLNITAYLLPGLEGMSRFLADVTRGGESAQKAMDWVLGERVTRFMVLAGHPLLTGPDKRTSSGKIGGKSGGMSLAEEDSLGDRNIAGLRAQELIAAAGGAGGGKGKAATYKRAFDPESDFFFAVDESLRKKQRAQFDADEKEIEGLEKKRIAMEKMAEERMEQQRLESDGEEAIRLAMEKTTREMKTQDDMARQLGFTFSSAFEDAMIGGKGLREVLHGIVQDIARIALRKSVTEPLGNSLGKMFSGGGGLGGIGKLFEGMFNPAGAPIASQGFGMAGDAGSLLGFAGGGFTGSGARSGGMDGQGGFLAMLHPQETVIDHAQGGGAGGAVTVILNISTGVAQTVRAEISNLLPSISASVQGAVMDARLRGGSTRAAYRG